MDSSRVKAVARSPMSIKTGMTIALSLALLAPGAVAGQSPSPSDVLSHGADPSAGPSPLASSGTVCVLPPPPEPGTIAADLQALVNGFAMHVAAAALRTALGLPQPCPAPEADSEVAAAPSPTPTIEPSPSPGPVASPFVALTAKEAILRPKHQDVSFKRLRRLALKTYDANPPEVIPRDAWSWGRKWLVWNLKTVRKGHPKINKAFSGRTEVLRLLMPINSQRFVEWAYRQYLVTRDDSYLDVARHAYWYAETRFGKRTLAKETYVREHIASLTPETADGD